MLRIRHGALTVMFDHRCGKCRRFIRLSRALDMARRLEPIGLSDPRVAREYGRFDRDALNYEMHVIDAHERVFRASTRSSASQRKCH
jgi:predicted DCC family thiol-disulfide oxidoreductase YuxK